MTTENQASNNSQDGDESKSQESQKSEVRPMEEIVKGKTYEGTVVRIAGSSLVSKTSNLFSTFVHFICPPLALYRTTCMLIVCCCGSGVHRILSIMFMS